jgi:hypothetical protein
MALAVSGCGKGTSGTNPSSPMTQESADDIALNTVVALNTVGGDIEGAGVSAGIAALVQPGDTRARMARSSSAQFDTTFVRDSITFHVTRTWIGVLGDTLTGPGPGASRLLWTSDASGHWTSARDTAQVGHHGDLTVSGSQPLLALADTIVFNGASFDTLDNSFRSLDSLRTRRFHWESSLALLDVHWPKGGSYPASGTVTINVIADRYITNGSNARDGHWNATVVITFDGTANANVTVNGTWHYHWNLVTQVIARA